MNEPDTKSYITSVTEALKSSVLQMLVSMAMTEVRCTGHREMETFCVSGPATGLMVLVGEYRTVVAICMPETLLRGLIASITGGPQDTLTEQELSDGIGEMVNMICGGMKTKLEGGDVELLPPMSIIGGGYNAEWKTDSSTLVLEFESKDGAFSLYTCRL